jgi:hypothetical protein
MSLHLISEFHSHRDYPHQAPAFNIGELEDLLNLMGFDVQAEMCRRVMAFPPWTASPAILVHKPVPSDDSWNPSA